MPGIPSREVEQFVQASVVLHVPDVRAAAEHYRDVMGFEVDFVMGEPAQYAVVWRENAAVHFSRSEEVGDNVHLFMWVKDVDGYYEELVRRGANVVMEPVTQPYSIRECAVEDLNGVRVVFGQDDEIIREAEVG